MVAAPAAAPGAGAPGGPTLAPVTADAPPPPPPPPPPAGDAGDGRDPFWGPVLRPIAAVLLAFGLAIPLAALLLATPLSEDTVNAAFVAIGGALILFFGLIFFRALPEEERREALAVRRPRAGGFGNGPLRAVAAGIGMGLAIMVLSAVVIALALQVDAGLEDRLEDAAAEIGPTPLQMALAVTALVVLAPLGEELVFRAMLLRGLTRRIPFWPAALISGALFAAAHVDAYILWPRAITLTATGVALAWLYRRRGFWAAVTAHATVNGVAAVAIIATG